MTASPLLMLAFKISIELHRTQRSLSDAKLVLPANQPKFFLPD